MSLLSILDGACSGLKLAPIGAYVGSTEKLARELINSLNRILWMMRNRYEWAELIKQCSITLADGVESYAIPGDYNRMVDRTSWSTATNWELLGPLTPQEWNWIKEGTISSVGPRQRFRLKGNTGKRLFIDPVPSSGEAGQIIVFEYVSENCIFPVQWVTGTAYLANQYVSNLGNIYYANNNGTSGATAPVHTSGVVTDGVIGWHYFTGAYTSPLADTDSPIFDETLVQMGVEWHFLESNGLDFVSRRTDWEREVLRHLSRFMGSRTLSVIPSNGGRFLGYDNIPDTGYG